jgi:AcrR family transcriptional regulator
MGIIERKQRQKEEVRTAILEAAWQLVLQDGWQALSIRKIADAIEYSVPVIYTHFESKDALLMEFTREGFRQLNADLEEARDAAATPSAQLEAMAHAYWSFAVRNPEYYQLMYGLGMPTCETVRQIPELVQFSQLNRTVIQALIGEGRNPEADVMLKFTTYWSMLHGFVSIHMTSTAQATDEFKQMVFSDLVKGVIKNIRD